MPNRKTIFLGISLVALVIATVFVASELTKETIPTDIVEVKEYKGKDPSLGLGPQNIDAEDYRLVIIGLVDNELNLAYDEIISKYQHITKIVKIYSVDGWNTTTTWEGVLLSGLLDEAGINSEATSVTFYAYDDFSTSLPLEYIIGNNITMGYKINGKTLPPENGFPFQLVAESEYGFDWIRWITKIEITE